MSLDPYYSAHHVLPQSSLPGMHSNQNLMYSTDRAINSYASCGGNTLTAYPTSALTIPNNYTNSQQISYNDEKMTYNMLKAENNQFTQGIYQQPAQQPFIDNCSPSFQPLTTVEKTNLNNLLYVSETLPHAANQNYGVDATDNYTLNSADRFGANVTQQQPKQQSSYLSANQNIDYQQQYNSYQNQKLCGGQYDYAATSPQQTMFYQQQNTNFSPIQQQTCNMAEMNHNVAISASPQQLRAEAGLATLYRETDHISQTRNRSNSMTDVLFPGSPMSHDLGAKRSLDHLGHDFNNLRLEDQYANRRGSGTFHKPNRGQEFGDEFAPRRRFPSMDPSFLSSSYSRGDSPLSLSSVWTPLKLDAPVLSASNSMSPELLNIEEFTFQSDDEDILIEGDADVSDDKFAAADKREADELREAGVGYTVLTLDTPPAKVKQHAIFTSPESIAIPARPVNPTPAKAMSVKLTPGKIRPSDLQPASVKSNVTSKPTTAAATSWSQIVQKKPAFAANTNTSSSNIQVTRSRSTSTSPQNSPSPTNPLLDGSNTDNNACGKPIGCGVVEFHRGPKVDPRWPVDQQLFLGPIPVSVTWDDIRNTFYAKVDRPQILHTYVQSKPVNDVVYGQIVFDKPSLAAKILKEGPIKVSGRLISVTAMKDKLKNERKR